METPNRIQQTSITPTISRQTPNNDFGTVMARTVHAVVHTGAGMIGSFVGGGGPVLSAAVAGATQAVSATPSISLPGSGLAGKGESVPGASGSGDQWDLLKAQGALQQEGYLFNSQYLALQNEMQRESREFNAVTNIMKVRHDSAKAAINNVR